MNVNACYFASRREAAARQRAEELRARINATLKPCPELRERRLRQMSPERRARAKRNAAEIAEMLRQ